MNNFMIDENKDVYDFEVGDELSDVRLIVEDRVLNVHKAILGKKFLQMIKLNKI